MKAFISYSIHDRDAYLVYNLGDLVKNYGFTPEYNYETPKLPLRQRTFDEIAGSEMFLGIITASMRAKQVIEEWEYAKARGITSVLFIHKNTQVPSRIAGDKDVVRFDPTKPENPVKYIELMMSRK